MQTRPEQEPATISAPPKSTQKCSLAVQSLIFAIGLLAVALFKIYSNSAFRHVLLNWVRIDAFAQQNASLFAKIARLTIFDFVTQLLLIPRPGFDLVIVTNLAFKSRLATAAVYFPSQLISLLIIHLVARKLLNKKLGQTAICRSWVWLINSNAKYS